MKKVISNQIKTFEEWEELLLPIEIEALNDYCYGIPYQINHEQSLSN